MSSAPTKEAIAARAEQDARGELETGRPALCPYPFESAAAVEWRILLTRYLAEFSRADNTEGGA